MTEKEINTVFKRVESELANQKSKESLTILKGLRKSLTSQQEWYLGKAYFWEALCYKNLGKIDLSIISSNKGIKIFTKLNDFVEVSKLLRDQGLSYEYSGEYDLALKQLHSSVELLNKKGVIDSLGITLSKIGKIYFELKNYEKALYYNELGYSICREGNNPFFLLTSILPLLLTYYKIGNYTVGMELIAQAESLLEKISQTNGYKNMRRESELLLLKALFLTKLNKMEESFKLFLMFKNNYSNSASEDNKFFKNSYELKELLSAYLQTKFEAQIVKEFKALYNI
jgi:tetratricopeptide (TPR) repeat protein